MFRVLGVASWETLVKGSCRLGCTGPKCTSDRGTNAYT